MPLVPPVTKAVIPTSDHLRSLVSGVPILDLIHRFFFFFFFVYDKFKKIEGSLRRRVVGSYL